MMKLIVSFDELDTYGDVRGDVSQKFREKILDQFLENQFPAWSIEVAFASRNWEFWDNEVHIEMVPI